MGFYEKKAYTTLVALVKRDQVINLEALRHEMMLNYGIQERALQKLIDQVKLAYPKLKQEGNEMWMDHNVPRDTDNV